jgi:hypothetical protein
MSRVSQTGPDGTEQLVFLNGCEAKNPVEGIDDKP